MEVFTDIKIYRISSLRNDWNVPFQPVPDPWTNRHFLIGPEFAKPACSSAPIIGQHPYEKVSGWFDSEPSHTVALRLHRFWPGWKGESWKRGFKAPCHPHRWFQLSCWFGFPVSKSGISMRAAQVPIGGFQWRKDLRGSGLITVQTRVRPSLVDLFRHWKPPIGTWAAFA